MIANFMRGVASATLLALTLGGLALGPASAATLSSEDGSSQEASQSEGTEQSSDDLAARAIQDSEEAREVSAVEFLPQTGEELQTPSLTEDVAPLVSTDPVPSAVFEDVEILSIVIEGSAKVGKTITATATFNVVPDSVEYQWYSDDDEIVGADGPTLLLIPNLIGKRISVVVFAELEESEFFSAEWSDETDPVTQDEDVEPPVVAEGIEIMSLTIDGVAKVGKVLTANATFNMDPDFVVYQWLADEEFIDGAEDSTLLLTSDLVGKKISVLIFAVLEEPEDYDFAWSDETAAVVAADVVPTEVVEEDASAVVVRPVAGKVVVNEVPKLADTGASATTPLVAGLCLMLLGAAAALTRRRLVRN